MTIETNWFFLLEMLEIIAFAMSGVLIAFKEKYSIIGALVLASLPAVGGGIIRDLMVNRELSIFRMPVYIFTIIIIFITNLSISEVFSIKQENISKCHPNIIYTFQPVVI